MFEKPGCQFCDLSGTAKPASRCLRGEGGIDAKLAIYAEHPAFMDNRREMPFVSDPGMLLRWMLRRMSIPPSAVYLDYVVKCYPGKKLPSKKPERMYCIDICNRYLVATLQAVQPKEIVAFGGLCLEAFLGHTGNQLKFFTGAFWTPRSEQIQKIVSRVWIGYSIGYPIAAPGESDSQFGLLWMAAEAAGLEPKIDENVKPFKYPPQVK